MPQPTFSLKDLELIGPVQKQLLCLLLTVPVLINQSVISSKMSLSMICKLWPFAVVFVALTVIHHMKAETMVSVAMTSDGEGGNDLIRVGDTVTFLCNIVEFPDPCVISIVRTISGDPETLYSNPGQPDNVTENIDFRGYTEPQPGNRLYSLMINDVKENDAGKYSCVIFDFRTNVPISDTLTLDIQERLYLPDPVYPKCNIISEDKSLTRYKGEQVTLRCETEIGNPEVYLDWELLGTVISSPKDEVFENNIKYISVVVNLQIGHDGKTFDCVMIASLDPNYKPMCSVGPFDIQSRPTSSTSMVTTSHPDQSVTTLHSDQSLTPEQGHVTSSSRASTDTTIISLTTENQTDGGPDKPAAAGLSMLNLALICIIIIIIILTLCTALLLGIVYKKCKMKTYVVNSVNDAADSNGNDVQEILKQAVLYK